jgi:hypothetical protein
LAKQVAEEAGAPGSIVVTKTGMITSFEASRIPGLGESTTTNNRAFATYATGKSMRIYTVGSSTDAAGNRYRFLKTGEKDSFVPTFAEAKTEALNAWKTIEARKLVDKRLEELVAEARKQQKPLKTVFAKEADKIFDPAPFSWLTRSTADVTGRGAPPRLSEVDGVVDPGEEFLRGVFRLEDDGAVGVTWNNPKTVGYVVQIKSFSPSPHVLRETFLIDPPQDIEMASINDQRRTFRAWLTELEKAANLKWQREPTPFDEA